jgi:hypothetical protein
MSWKSFGESSWLRATHASPRQIAEPSTGFPASAASVAAL